MSSRCTMFEAVDIKQEVTDMNAGEQDSGLPNEETEKIGIPKMRTSANEIIGIKEDPDSTETKYSNKQDYIEVEIEKLSNPNTAPAATLPAITIKQELEEPDIYQAPMHQQNSNNQFDPLTVKEEVTDTPLTVNEEVTDASLTVKEEVSDTPLAVKEEVTDTPGTSDGQTHFQIEVEAIPDWTKSTEAPETATSGGNSPRLDTSTTSTEEKRHKCKVCNYQCNRPSNLKRHMRVHLGVKPHKCSVCEYRCRETNKLKIHMRKHTEEKPYKCEDCDYQSRFSFNLKNHRRIHTVEEPYKCETCGFQCKLLSSFQRHLRNHETPYSCDLCDYRNAHASNLKSHMRLHSDDKPFKCKDCDYQSKHLHHLTRHMRRHTGERPYKCQDCDYQAKTLCNLKIHMKKHIE